MLRIKSKIYTKVSTDRKANFIDKQACRSFKQKYDSRLSPDAKCYDFRYIKMQTLMADTPENCVFYKEPLGKGEIATFGEKESASVNRASLERDGTICTVPGQQVQQYCRNIHGNPNKIA